AYASLAAGTRRELHWKIGNELLGQLAGLAGHAEHGDFRHADERLFEVVDHLDAGVPADLDEARTLELAQLDLRAGRRALANSAHELAQRYLVNGIALIGSHPAERQHVYELAFGLHFMLARTLGFLGRRDQADVAFAQL